MKTKEKQQMSKHLITVLIVVLTVIAAIIPCALSAGAHENHRIVVFGSYPQDKVIDTSLIKALNTRASDTSIWKSYDFYIQGNKSSFMKMTDVVYNGKEYRGVYFDRYRPYGVNYPSSATYSFQDENGYLPGTVYWFSFEPLEWVEYENGIYQCATPIDALQLHETDTIRFSESSILFYYTKSHLRSWLTDDFYNVAFTDEQKSEILVSNDLFKETVGLSGIHIGLDGNSTEPSDCKGTDYAKCMGLRCDSNNNATYWNIEIDANGVNIGPESEAVDCTSTCIGVCPRITLGSMYDIYESSKEVQFGSYPQKLVTDEKLSNAITAAAPGLGNWKSYGYLINSESGDFMKYCDFTYINKKYRGVYISKYRPVRTDRKSSESNQDDYGFKTGIFYWFEYKPITWTIVNKASGLCISKYLLDSQPFLNYEPNYTSSQFFQNPPEQYDTSSIRSWLQNTFLTGAFNTFEKSKLQTLTHISYFTGNTIKESVSLITVSDYDTYGGIADQTAVTDYAKIQGIGQFKEGVFWWRNGPDGLSDRAAKQSLAQINDVNLTITIDSWKLKGQFFFTTSTEVGVRPTVKLNFNNEQGTSSCAHSNLSDWKVDKPATCTTSGREIKVCTGCGKEMESRIATASHSFNGNKYKCNGDGTHYRICSLCQQVYGGEKIKCFGGTATCQSRAKCTACGGVYGSYGDHKFTSGISNNDATCLQDGTGYLVCELCSAKKLTVITGSKKPHSYTGAYKSNGNGTHSRLCVNGCGLTDPKNEIYCSGGTASCETESICSVCSGAYGPTGHAFKATTSNNDATCLSDGTKQGMCTKCKKFVVVTDKGSKLSHSYTGSRMLSNGDGTHSRMCVNGCKQPGGTKYACSGGTATCVSRAICTNCGGKYGDYSDSHLFENYVTVTAATCMQQGTKQATCSREGCNVTKTETIPKVAHSFTGGYVSNGDKTHSRLCKYGCGTVSSTTQACSGGTATCTSRAICSLCNTPYGSKAEHIYTSFKPNNDATCLKQGTRTRHCHNCEKVQTSKNPDDPIKAHSYTGAYKANGDGTHSRLCVNGCGLTDPNNKTSCSGGSASCDKKAKCTVCGGEYGDYKHSFGTYTYNSDATCLSGGTKSRICSSCSYKQTVSDSSHSKLSHSYMGEYKSNGDGTHSSLCVNGCGQYGATSSCHGGTASCIKQAVCVDCGTSYGSKASHNYTNIADGKYLKSNANCESSAVYYRSCSICGAASTATFNYGEKNMNNHTHLDSYGNCSGCGKVGENPNPSQNCSCRCHQGGFQGFIWKILRIFYKIFGTNKTCQCGVAHY